MAHSPLPAQLCNPSMYMLLCAIPSCPGVDLDSRTAPARTLLEWSVEEGSQVALIDSYRESKVIAQGEEVCFAPSFVMNKKKAAASLFSSPTHKPGLPLGPYVRRMDKRVVGMQYSCFHIHMQQRARAVVAGGGVRQGVPESTAAGALCHTRLHLRPSTVTAPPKRCMLMYTM